MRRSSPGYVCVTQGLSYAAVLCLMLIIDEIAEGLFLEVEMELIAQVNENAERMQSMVGVVVILLAAAAAVYFSVRAFMRSEVRRKEKQWMQIKAEEQLKAKAAEAAKDSERKLDELFAILESAPESPEVHSECIMIVEKYPGFAESVYQRALTAVEVSRGGSKSKQFALLAGRLAYGRRRGGLVTQYDEQAILNDISARD